MFDDREMRRPTQGVPVQHSCESIAKIASNKSSDLHIQGDPWDGSALKSQQISFLHTLSPRHQNTQDVTDSSVGCVPLSVFIQNRPRAQRVDTCTWQCGSVTAVHYSTQKYKSRRRVRCWEWSIPSLGCAGSIHVTTTFSSNGIL